MIRADTSSTWTPNQGAQWKPLRLTGSEPMQTSGPVSEAAFAAMRPDTHNLSHKPQCFNPYPVFDPLARTFAPTGIASVEQRNRCQTRTSTSYTLRGVLVRDMSILLVLIPSSSWYSVVLSLSSSNLLVISTRSLAPNPLGACRM